MKLLLADDDPMYLRLMQRCLRSEFEISVANNGADAWRLLTEPPVPKIAVLNWMMPQCDGVELCHKIRNTGETVRIYVVLVTAKSRLQDVLNGFNAGADDYVLKPFHPSELRARVKVGSRIVGLQDALADRIEKLQDALAHVRTLRRLLPICSYCKRIRDDHDYWAQLEQYLGEHADLEFSHGICPSCYEKYWKSELTPEPHEVGS